MTRQEIEVVFNEVKREAKLDYALTEGHCCPTCTSADIKERFGNESKGIWLMFFEKGVNGQKWNENEKQYIAHKLTLAQKEIVYNVFSRYFDVEWDNMSDRTCIIISGKNNKE